MSTQPTPLPAATPELRPAHGDSSVWSAPDWAQSDPVPLELVDDAGMAVALDSRWNSDCLGDMQLGTPLRRGLLVIDPLGRWTDGVLQSLIDATGGQPSRIRVLSPVGLRERAIIDELCLPRVAHRPDAVRFLRLPPGAKLDTAAYSPTLARLWRHTALVAVLLGAHDSVEAARCVLQASAVASRLGEDGPQWAFFMAGEAPDLGPAAGGPAWLQRMAFHTAPAERAKRATATGMWNAMFEAWVRVTA